MYVTASVSSGWTAQSKATARATAVATRPHGPAAGQQQRPPHNTEQQQRRQRVR